MFFGEITGGCAPNAFSVSTCKWIVKQEAATKVLSCGYNSAMIKNKSPLVYFLATVAIVALITLLGPEEKSLGSNVRIVYLHGAWVLAAELAFIAAGLAGLLGLLLRRDSFHAWSAALGRTGIVFWLTYLPLSLFAMQANWNGLFLAEPRFRIAIIFAVTGILLQIGLWLFNISWLTSLANILYIVALRVVFATAKNIMHPPPSPIFSSGLWNIIAFFVLLNILAWAAAYFLTRFFLTFKSSE
ncbi:MAG: hypothetical protein K8S20_14275 [Chloroflexi bacterium]|nr:hypothetical protein [Chloroflexota bacterium]